ncbi:hypothetical protein EPUS_07042 [Endocarpon pusillum Z07020]|uniref:Uncharacterized protein n=1 Tax=Endocarpon pusillum (strain Z07020 / HMAS-L-300199) TaxID=1263415 RepID=U1GDJ5_ENDPU|nr:uncharacterized protein EPUS_07042 [Endocarpon pusillum Z07020]ERF69786.1 hypothetical protein EPUS_07042 [Endocarpon pusillum Z07020]
MSGGSESGAGPSRDPDFDLIDLAAEDAATAQQLKLFEKLILSNGPFRQKIRERKQQYIKYGDPDKADRLNETMVRVLRICLTKDASPIDFRYEDGSEQDRASEEADVDWDDQDGLFHRIANGEASMTQRSIFRDRLLRSNILYSRVSNLQKVWASMSSHESQKMAKNLERALTRCDTMRAEMQKDTLLSGESSRDISLSVGTVSGGSRPAPEGPSRPRESHITSAKKRPSLTPDQSLEEVDLIELVACSTASATQVQYFVSEFKNNKAFQHRVLARDKKYLSSNSSEDYEKAANLRISTGAHGNVQSLHLYPWNSHLVEGFQLVEERLNQDDGKKVRVMEAFTEELQLLQIQRAVEASANVSKRRGPTRVNQSKGSPAAGSSARGSQTQEQSPGKGQGPAVGGGLLSSRDGSSAGGPVNAEHPSSAERSCSAECPSKKPSSGRGRPPLHPGPPAALASRIAQEDAAHPTAGAPSTFQKDTGLIAQGTPQPTRTTTTVRTDASQTAAIPGTGPRKDEVSQVRVTRSEVAAARTLMAARVGSHIKEKLRATLESTRTGSQTATETEPPSQSTANSSRSTSRTDLSPSLAAAKSEPPTGSDMPSETSAPRHQIPTNENAPVYSVVSEREMERLHSRIRETANRRIDPALATPNPDLILIESLVTNPATPSQLSTFRRKIQAEPTFRHLLLERYARYTLEEPVKAVRLHTVTGSLVGGPRYTRAALGAFGLETEVEFAAATRWEQSRGRGGRGGRAAMRLAELALAPDISLRPGPVARSGANITLGGGIGGRGDRAGRGPGRAGRTGEDVGRLQASEGQAINREIAAPQQSSVPLPSANARLIELVANNEATPSQIRSFEQKIQNDALFQDIVLDRIQEYYVTSSWAEPLCLRTLMTHIWIDKTIARVSVDEEGGDQAGQFSGPEHRAGASNRGPPAGTRAAAADEVVQGSGRLVRSLSDLLESSKPSR